MKTDKLKPWLLAVLFLFVFCMFLGAWATSSQKTYANTILGTGLAGILATIIIWVAIFGAQNRPSNWLKGKRY